jgi:hypothetical protein
MSFGDANIFDFSLSEEDGKKQDGSRLVKKYNLF